MLSAFRMKGYVIVLVVVLAYMITLAWLTGDLSLDNYAP